MVFNIRERLVEGLLTEADNRKKILKTFGSRGVTEEVATWAHELHNKQSTWVVDIMLKKYEAEMDGRHDKPSLEDFASTLTNTFIKFFELQKDQNRPLVKPKDYNFDGISELIDKYSQITSWLSHPDSNYVDLKTLTWDEAFGLANQWFDGLVPEGEVFGINKNSEIYVPSDGSPMNFGDGFYWAVTKNFKNKESSSSMGHCGEADYKLPKEIKEEMWLFHLRKGEEEFITWDWHPRDNYTRQAKGKANTKPKEIYHKYIIWLLDNLNIKLHTPLGYSPATNFHLGDLKPEVAGAMFAKNPDIMGPREILQWAPEENKGPLAANLIKNEDFLLSLIPNKFIDYFNMVDSKDGMIESVLNSPSFFKRLNRYDGYLTFVLGLMLDSVADKDNLIEKVIKYNDMVNMLDDEGGMLLIQSHSNPAEVEEFFNEQLYGYEEEEEPTEEPTEEPNQQERPADDEEMAIDELYESKRGRKSIIIELRKKFGKRL